MGALTFSAGGDAELAMTLHNRRPEIIDNIFQGIPTFRMMKAMNAVEVTDEGGVGIVRQVLFEKNGTAESFSGFDTFLITPQDNETGVQYPWSAVRSHVAVAWDEETRNSGKAQLVHLANQKTDVAEMTLKDEINLQLTQTPPAAASKDLSGWHEIIDADQAFADPVRLNSIGGISQNANAWWRNKIMPAAGAAQAFAVGDMLTLYNRVSDGSDYPSFILATQGSIEAYEDSQVGQIRYAPYSEADASFRTMMYKQTPITWDPQLVLPATVPASTTQFQLFVNAKYTKLIIHTRGQFATGDFIEADNGNYKTAKITFMGQLVATNRRRNGIYAHTGT